MQVVRWLTECGNGVVEGEEQCDDGNTEGGDGCSSVCKVLPSPVHSPCLIFLISPVWNVSGPGQKHMCPVLSWLKGRLLDRLSYVDFRVSRADDIMLSLPVLSQVLDRDLACRLSQAGSAPARTPQSAGHARTQRTAAHQD